MGYGLDPPGIRISREGREGEWSQSMKLILTSRYSVLGPPNGCRGRGEGTGWVPVPKRAKATRQFNWPALWAKARKEAGRHRCDGWHFVRCPMCRRDGSKTLNRRGGSG